MLNLPDHPLAFDELIAHHVSPDLATSFSDRDIVTFEDLYEFMAHCGNSWFKQIAGLSRQEAQQVVNWFREYGQAIGEITPRFELGGTESAPQSRKTTPPQSKPSSPTTLAASPYGICPLERLTVSESLRGLGAVNRAPTVGCALSCQYDLEAIYAWLEARAMNPNTQQSYRKEAERFYLWCLFERKKALSAIMADDASAYAQWIQALGRTDEKTFNQRWKLPQEAWLGAKNTPRDHHGWRPFYGPLNVTSRHHALVIVRQLFNFLKRTGFLLFNPFDQVSTKTPQLPSEAMPTTFADRSLTPSQWQAVLDALEALPEDYKKARLRLMLGLGKGLGLRASEMAAARAGWVEPTRLGLKTQWTLSVLGKGAKVRRLPLNRDMLHAIQEVLRYQGYPELDAAPSDAPLLTNLGRGAKAHQALSRSGIYKVLDGFFDLVANTLAETNPRDAAKLRASSTHWLRHTFAIEALNKVEINVVQRALGHSSVATTGRYLTPDEEELARAMESMKV